ncbi:MAG TPA: HAMP domain-containing sensor histidine kinase [Amycolatopsis sp.]|uniref:sensor histidine kinase n=1 Tax=Amycolatopsis sp. TaxID=37632 RepID=UPI002B48C192|nr:HAMP domain-containing sensor histidine kinase [Amycolatopsis sp.]HKS46208.1 HAMP domain-containing sensor histidine kinase [Amycolatopsis sp.]
MRSIRLFADRVWAKRRTVRMRLTLVYGGLFLLSASALLALTYVLVSNATQGAVSFRNDAGISGSIDELPTPLASGQAAGDQPQLTPSQVDQQVQVLRDRAIRQRSDNLHQLVVQAGFALAIMVAVSIVLGWLIAGRILRRLRTITLTARRISATDLHRRLDLPGPDDELRQLGDTIDELLSRLEASFQAQRQFVANASHEMRTPLARQRVLGQVALDDPDATVESLRTAHRRVLAAGERQDRLITALLTLAKGQSGIEAHEPFDLETLVEEALSTRLPEAATRGLSLRTRLSPAATSGDPQLAERLVTNLVDNALRHNVAGGTVDIGTDVVNGRPELSVSNTGPEVAPGEIERLFQPFQRRESDRTAKTEGLGLGLSIVHAIVEAHDATIDARPRPGGGLSIRVVFPVYAGETRSERTPASAPAGDA